MTQRGRLGFLGVLLLGAGTLVASFLLRPFVPSAFATDTDSDGISDADEAAYGTLNNDSDTDNDGLSDFDEIFIHGTNPLDDDTDGDGTLDNVDGNPLQNGSTVDGTTTPTSTWSSNLTRPNFNGTTAEDGKAVLIHSGEFVHTVNLLSIRAGRGPDMELTATYRSGISFDGIAGNNWTLSFMERVVESGNNVYWFPPDGTRVLFTSAGGLLPITYTNPADVVGWTMVKTGSSTFTLTDPHGNETEFQSDGQVDSKNDRFGNTITYSYTANLLTGITDAVGHAVTITYYSGTGRVKDFTDDSNRKVTLEYNCNGQLARHFSPATTQFPAGLATEYRYTAGLATSTLNDNLIRILDPGGHLWLRNQPDGNDRVTVQYLGNDDFTFSYNMGSGVTTVTDRAGNQRDWAWTGVLPTSLTEYSNRNVRAGDSGNDDPTSWVTTFGHTSAGFRNKVVLPRGNRIDRDYDSAGNVTEIRRKTTDTDTDSSVNDLFESFEYDSHFNLMTEHTDARGNVTTYTLPTTGTQAYMVVDSVTHPTVTYLTPDQTVVESYTWNAYGQIATRTDGEGSVTTWNYVGGSTVQKGYVASIVVDDGGLDLTTAYTYTAWGATLSVTNPRGFETTYTVNELGWVLTETTDSPQGYEIKYVHTANGLVSTKDVENVDKTNTRDTGNPWFTTTYTYDLLDQLTEKEEEISSSVTRTTEYTYTANGMLEQLTQPEGNKVFHVYDERDLVYTTTRGYTSGVASTAKSYYDANRNRSKWTNGRAKSWTSTYDLFDRRDKATNPLGHYTETIYDKDGNVAEVKRWEEAGSTDVLKAQSKQTFDEMGRLYKVEKGLLASSTWSWLATTLTLDERSAVTAVTDPRGKVTEFGYDGAGRRISMEDPLGNLVEWTLDENGNATLIEETETTGYSTAKTFVTERDFDEVDRLEEERVVNETNSADEHVTQFKYDSLNVLVERIDPETNTTTWTHDGLGRVLQESITLGASSYKTRTWAYDGNDRLTGHEDDAGNDTTWAYNARNLVTLETYADTYNKDFDYDLADNLTQWIDPNGTEVDLTWDDNNRNTARDISPGAGVGGTTEEDYVYDPLDRMTEAKDDDVTVQLAWDSLSRKLTEVSGPNPIGSSGKTTSYTYDNAGNVTQIGYPDGTFVVNRTVDDVNRLTLAEDGSSVDMVAVEYYGPGGRLKKLTFGNTMTAESAYNGFRWLSDLDHKTSGSTLRAGYDLVYDKVGNILYEEWGHDSGKGHNYYYDKAYRLTKTLQNCLDPSAEVATPGSQTYGTKLEYNLSDDSDRTSVVTTPYGLSATTVNYTSNSTHAYTVINSVNRSHDLNGNLTDDGTFEYEYDYRNQLLTATRKSNSHVEGTYEYDALGRRTKKTLYGGASLRYYHDGVHEVEEYDGSGNLVRKYVYRQDIDSIAMMEAADVADVDGDSNTSELVRLFYHYDARSNVARLTAAAQTVVEAYEYDPYGNVGIKDKNGTGVASTQVGNPFDFQRRRRDVETGLLYFRARMYDPVAGHWLQRDPLGFGPGANWREFEASAPTAREDPSGTQDAPKTSQDAAKAKADVAAAQRDIDTLKNELKSLEDKYDTEFKRLTSYKVFGVTYSPGQEPGCLTKDEAKKKMAEEGWENKRAVIRAKLKQAHQRKQEAERRAKEAESGGGSRPK